MQQGLAQELAFVPDWHGDESLYSWVASYHETYGNGSHRDTGILLFGAAHACKERDAPPGISHFVSATGGHLGSLPELLRKRCSIGLFIPFLTPAKRTLFLARVEAANGPGWVATLGMSASGLSPSSHLRYCESCIDEDLANTRLPRWRRPHQLAASWICLEHSRLLKTTVHRSFTWVLPNRSIGEYLQAYPTPAQYEVLLKLSGLAQFAAFQPHLDLGAIRQSALCELRQQGVSSWSHPLSKERLTSWFCASPLAAWLKTAQTPESSLAAGTWIHDLLRGRRGDHPLKWLILWVALFSHEQEASIQRRFSSPWSEPQWDFLGQSSLWIGDPDGLPSDISHVILGAETLADAAQKLGLTVGALRDRLERIGGSGGSFRQGRQKPLLRVQAVNSIHSFIASRPGCTLRDIHRECKAAVSWLRANSPEDFAAATQKLQADSRKQMRLF